MSFLNPGALFLSLLAVPILALYFLKLRREPYVVSSTYLWRRLVRDMAANAPWQRLRPNLLLLLQLLILAALVLALARPFTWSEAAAGDHVILILDTSASMQATDVPPNRLVEAVRRARRLVQGLPAETRVTVITAGGDTRVWVSGSTDHARVLEALDGVRAGVGSSDLSAALGLAAAIAARERDPETIILSDGNVTLPERTLIPGRVRYVPIGRGAAEPDAVVSNQGILALSLRPIAGGQAYSAFVQVRNFGSAPVERRLLLYADGELIAARTLALPPGEPRAMAFDEVPGDARVVEARLEGEDFLALDDVAWAVPSARRSLRVELVSPGNRFLETALSLMPGLEVTSVRPEDYGGEVCPDEDAECPTPDLTIFDGVAVDDPLPAGALWFLAPVRATSLFSVTGRIPQPVPAAAHGDEPLLRYVDLRGVHVMEAAQIPLPDWARAVVIAEGFAGTCGLPCPLLLVGEVDGRRVAVLAFDLRKSDLPLRVAFPILVANLIDYLSAGEGMGGPLEGARPGRPVTIPVPPEAEAVLVTLPDGSVERVDVRAGRAVFDGTTQLGVYEVAWVDGGEHPLGRFAVNLFDAAESAIAPANKLAVQGTVEMGGAGESPRGRREWWRALAWAGLALLLAEWLYAHRGHVARLRARLAGATLAFRRRGLRASGRWKA
ncbi:MAG: VWA domain-containing protein [Chloroflexi bacterium]|nr:VWA domain-containing protein [Chloroflexota bacterium]